MLRPHAEGRYCQLFPLVGDDDVAFLYDLLLDPEVGLDLRFQGATPSRHEFVAHAWDHVLAQWVIVSRTTGRRVGAFIVSSPDHRNGFAYVTFFGVPARWGRVVLIEAVALGVAHVFSTWPFRQLYAEMDDHAFERVRSGEGRFFELDGRRRNHVFLHGRYRDVYLLRITRERFQQQWEPRLNTFISRGGQ
jgi:RimJ/RimL family protein N-acetyltransferase